MKPDSQRWVTVTESEFAHERDGLERVRSNLTDHDPYYAWSNFTFISDQGQPYEVDLLVLGPAGLYLVELKAWSGDIRPVGNGHRLWRAAGQERDNPFLLADNKAKRLKSVLGRGARRHRVTMPFVSAAVLLHSRGVKSHLPADAAANVYCGHGERGTGLTSIIEGLQREPSPGRRPVSPQDARRMKSLIDDALQPRQRRALMGSWALGAAYDDGPGWIDHLASHQHLPDSHARVRRYYPPPGASDAQIAAITAGAQREFTQTRGLQHPGLVVPTEYYDLDGVAAVVYNHSPTAQQLPAWMTVHPDADIVTRLRILRQLGESLRYAHEQNLTHRGLRPGSILIDDGSDGLSVQVKDWHTLGEVDARASRSATHFPELRDLADPAEAAFQAPEVTSGNVIDYRPADVFSLGALAYLLVTRSPPADSVEELADRLRDTDGLDISAVEDAAPELLTLLVEEATHPIVSRRTPSVQAFLANLDDVIAELHGPPTEDVVTDPLDAVAGSELEGGFVVKRILGRGGSALALEVERGEPKSSVLKVALDERAASHLEDEATALEMLHDSDLIVDVLEPLLTIGGRTCMHLALAGDRLADEIQRNGRLSLDRLQRWGLDLLAMVALLDRSGVAHRDIKPANLAYRARSADRQPHLVLFDFSLAGISQTDLTAGTPGYRDPFLKLDRRTHFDAAAELFSASVTLYEMATGTMPRWGDGRTAPDQLSDEVSIEASALDASVAEPLAAFFRSALARSVADRFDNAHEAAQAWRRVFEAGTESPEGHFDAAAESADLDTLLAQAGLSQRALSALERYQVATVAELLELDPLELSRIPGATQTTKNEIVARAKDWRRRLLRVAPEPGDGGGPRGLEVVRKSLLRGLDEKSLEGRVARLMLGLPNEEEGIPPLLWPTPRVVAEELSAPLSEVNTAWRGLVASWAKRSALTDLSDDVRDILVNLQGVGSADEVAARLITRRGSYSHRDQRLALAMALIRTVVERESVDVLSMRRTGKVIVLAAAGADGGSAPTENLDAAVALAPVADRLSSSAMLPTPATALDELRRTVLGTALQGLADPRLLSLAAAVSGKVSVGSRGELYPRGMSPLQSLRMARGSLQLVGAPMTVAALKRRVRARYPEAAELPDRPELDLLIEQARIDLVWNGDGYVVPGTTTHRFTSRTSTHSGPSLIDTGAVTRRLRRCLDSADFLALAVTANSHEAIRRRLLTEYPLTELDISAYALNRLRESADSAGADWRFVLRTDALAEDDLDRQTVRTVMRECLEGLPETIKQATTPLLLTQPGILARFDSLDLLAPVAAMSTRRKHAVMLLAAQPSEHGVPTVDGSAVPVSAPEQWLTVPRQWQTRPEPRPESA